MSLPRGRDGASGTSPCQIVYLAGCGAYLGASCCQSAGAHSVAMSVMRAGVRTHGEGVQGSRDFPLPDRVFGRVWSLLGNAGANPGALIYAVCRVSALVSLPRGGRRSFRDFPLPGAPLLVGCGAYLGSFLLPIRGCSFCGQVSGRRMCAVFVPMGKACRAPETSPCQIVYLAGCGAYLGSAGANPGTLVVPPMSACWGCDARRALRPVPSRLGVSASYTPLCCGGGSRGWGGSVGEGE